MLSFGELAKEFERAARECRSTVEVALADVGEVAVKAARDMIGHEMPDWPPLAESTIAEKTRLGYVGHVSATDPLLRTGQLRDSIEAEVDGLSVTVGSMMPEAKYQEYGTSRIPPRPFLVPAMLAAIAPAEEILGKIAVKLLSELGDAD